LIKKSEIFGQISGKGQLVSREKIEVTLIKLQTLKSEISELRLLCENLKKSYSENENKALLCKECGGPMEQGEEVVVKNFTGTEKSYYHKECFQAFWL